MGAHRLRELQHSEAIFQLLHPDLPSEFPPLQSLDNPALSNNLPVQVTSFIGREKEMGEIKSLLTQTRLLTLTGSGGCGKTRLSLQVSADVLEQFPDGVWVVELASLADPNLVPHTVASVFGIKEQSGQTLQQTLIDSLKSKHLLLLLDNGEHLLAACAQLTAALLRSCPNVKVLATSREPLGIAGELTYRVPSLSMPDPKLTPTFHSLSQYEAVQLFVERARFHNPTIAMTDRDAPALAQVCVRLDGIPLAIELASARVRSLSVEDINTRLDNRFRLLTGGDRTALPRQQTLRAMMDWSYDLLTETERRVLARLSVFAGGWTLEAAEQVCSGMSETGESIEDWDVLDLLTGLVDKSLVSAEEQDGSIRYRMLETVRQYASERLMEIGENEQTKTRHRDWCLALAEEARLQLIGAGQQRWLSRLERDHDNLRAALAWCVEEEAGAEAGLRLSSALWRFWEVRGHCTEGRTYLEQALGREGAQAKTKLRAQAVASAGKLASEQGDYEQARRLNEESLSICIELGDRRGTAHALIRLGLVASEQGDNVKSCRLYEESLAISRELEDMQGVALSLNNLGELAEAWS